MWLGIIITTTYWIFIKEEFEAHLELKCKDSSYLENNVGCVECSIAPAAGAAAGERNAQIISRMSAEENSTDPTCHA